MIAAEKWDAARLPDGFTAADGVALMALECDMSLEPWQFDAIACWFPADHPDYREEWRP